MVQERQQEPCQRVGEVCGFVFCFEGRVVVAKRCDVTGGSVVVRMVD
jgi:hypothetical protein